MRRTTRVVAEIGRDSLEFAQHRTSPLERRDTGSEHGAVCVPVNPDEIKFEREEHERHGTTGGFQEEVEKHAVNRERSNQGQSERNEAVGQQEGPDDQLRDCDELHHVSGFHQRSGKGNSSLGHGRCGLGDEVEESIEAEDQIRKADKDADGGGQVYAHKLRSSSIIVWHVIDGEFGCHVLLQGKISQGLGDRILTCTGKSFGNRFIRQVEREILCLGRQWA
jgi:hypothetical protein